MVVLGDMSDHNYRRSLEELIVRLDVKDRVLFHDAVPHCELWKYIGAADISMTVIEPVAKSYYLCLPNKLFESIQAHTPIVGSDFPEIKKIICQYKIGEVCKQDEVADVYRAVKEIKDNKEKQEQYRKNAEEASKGLCWEMESLRLMGAYRKYG